MNSSCPYYDVDYFNVGQEPPRFNRRWNCDESAKCLIKFAVRKDKPELCDKMRYNIELYNRCISEVALANMHPELCDKIDYCSLLDKCYLKVAEKRSVFNINNSSVFICDLIADEKTKWQCYRSVGGRSGIKDICLRISDFKLRNWCLSDIVINHIRSPEECDKIAYDKARYHCYWAMAVYGSNKALCGKIPEDDEYRKKCLQGCYNGVCKVFNYKKH